ncbi:hypothetical protein LINPERHAP2_LOCUS29663 [Linum perenne]
MVTNCFPYLETDFNLYLTFNLLSASNTCRNSNSSIPFTSFNCVHPLSRNLFNFFRPDRFGNSLIDSHLDISKYSSNSNFPRPLISVNCVHHATSNVFNFTRRERPGNFFIDPDTARLRNSSDSNVSTPVTSINWLQFIIPNNLRFLRLERSGNFSSDNSDTISVLNLVNMDSEDGTDFVNPIPINTKDSKLTTE